MASCNAMEAVQIWAPNASRVEIVVAQRRIEAIPEDAGWWRGPTLAPGDDYAISLDGGPPLPDPRSRWQPEGVHGPSRWLEPGVRIARPDTTPPHVDGALRDALIYELHVGTFTREGTFVAATSHLDHLVELGVTHVELMPVAQFPGTHGWGYDGVDLFAAHAPYGGPPGLHELIRSCHRRGLGVLIDVVHNHLGPEGAYLSQFGPYKTDRHHTPWGQAINLDGPDSREVRRFLIDSAIAWLREYGADGLRLDAIHSLYDTGPCHFVAELVDAVRALERELDRKLVVIGEYDDHDPRVVTERAAGGWGLDAHWNDDFHHAIHALLTGETTGYYADFADPGTLARVLERGYALEGGRSRHRGGPHGQPYGALPRDRLVGYIQSHDQVGNRGAGERLHVLCGIERAKLAAALLFVSPFVPMIFQGEEWAASTPFCYFADLQSPELREAVRAGRRAEHAAAGWTSAPIDPIDPATRDASVLRWDERVDPPHASMLAWYRELAAARRAHPSLRDPHPASTHVRRRGDVLEVERNELVLACNLGDEPVPLDLGGELVLASTATTTTRRLPPVSCALIRR
jgi:maltooligosyltrehalose trehalohydrolase